MEKSKLQIRTSVVEINLEGSMEQLVQDGPGLLQSILDMVGSVPPLEMISGSTGSSSGSSSLQMTTANISAKINAKTGLDLVKAAAAHMTICRMSDTFTRQQLLDEMKSASGYFKESYGKNLSNYLKTAVKEDLLREPSSGTYALSATAKSSLEASLA